MPPSPPVCHVVAGPNGSGKSTFALRYLRQWAGDVEFVNPDLMAQGVSPLDIRLSSFEAAKQTLRRIRTLASGRASFAFESTLAGRSYLGILESLRGAGYELDFYYLWMPGPDLLPSRIRHRVLAGGHDVPEADVLRRFARSQANLREYASRADALLVFDARLPVPELIYRRNGAESVFDAVRARHAKESLGL